MRKLHLLFPIILILVSLAERYHIPFHIFPITKENKEIQEIKELELIQQ